MKPKTVPMLPIIKQEYAVYGIKGGLAGAIRYSERGGHYVFVPNTEFTLTEETVRFIAEALEKLNKNL